MNILEILIIAALCFGAYRLGHSDGELAQKEAELFARLDKIIGQLKAGKDRP